MISDLVDGVLEAALSRLKDPELVAGAFSVHETVFVAEGLAAADDDVIPGFCLEYVGRVGVVRLLIDELVVRIAELVAPDLIPSKRRGILLRVEDGPVVLGPYKVCCYARDLIGQLSPGFEVPEFEGEDPAAYGISRVRGAGW
jgi:hypothetical protein